MTNPGGSDFSLLSRLFPGLAEELAKPGGGKPAGEAEAGEKPVDRELRVETAASRAPTLVFRGRYVHSARDPAREARRLAEILPLPGAGRAAGPGAQGGGPVVILGFGLGYTAEAAAERTPGRPLVLVERRREILKKALETRNLDRFLSENRIVFVVGGSGEAVSGALSLFDRPGAGGNPPDILRNRALTELDPDWYAGVEGRIRAWIGRNEVNAATLRRFGKRWVRNLARNLEAIRDIPGVKRLEGILAGGPAAKGEGPENGRESPAGNSRPGLPVFLAAAGPSLDLAGPLLKEIRKRCVIVAVDTSLRFMLSRGIDPDFAVAVDPQYWNARHLDRSAAERTWLIAESAVYPPVLRHPFRGSFLCRSLFPLGRFIEDRVDPKGALGAGGSVATSAWDFARLLGAPSVWIAGLDLSFPELKTHFRGALFETRSHAESGRRLPAETWSVRALRDGQPLMAAAAGGGEVLTDRRLSLYAAWFESRFREYPETRNYSLSPGGISIPGLELASPEALLALPERREEIDGRLEEAAALRRDFLSPETVRGRAERYEAAKSRLLEGLAEIVRQARSAASLARKALGPGGEAARGPGGKDSPPAKGLSGAERERLLGKLDAALAAIRESDVKDVAGFLFPPREAAGTEGAGLAAGTAGGPDPFVRYLEASAGMYQDLAEAAEYQLEALKKINRRGNI
ncbi:MAG: DUF115 domain-containing protein [Treponema sp.]|jgi:hypothetical protein|nr:DUF115 domain-containing protein [Treponema sp.]